MLNHNLLIAYASTDVLLAVWFVVLGGVVGSFLNVVVYRLPEGLSIVHPGSHCPRCKRPIRWYDNVPVFGWLWLRGRCRDCHLPIAARYPLVEAFTAVMFLAVWFVQGGLDSAASEFALVPRLGIAGYYLFLLSTLLPAALMAWDGKRPPDRLYWPAIVLGAVVTILGGDVPRPAAYAGANPWTDGILGAVAGLACGVVLSRLGRPRIYSHFTHPLLCIGLFLGWQAAVTVAAVGVLATVVLGVATRGRLAALPIWLFVATLGWILAWRWLVF